LPKVKISELSRLTPEEISQVILGLRPFRAIVASRTHTRMHLTIRFPDRLGGGLTKDTKVRYCRECSREFGGAMYHARSARCWRDKRAVINEGFRARYKF